MGCETRKKINIRKLMSELEKKLVQLNSTFARRVNKGGEERGVGRAPEVIGAKSN